MGTLNISLFKKFRVETDGNALSNLGSRKVQELLSYLLLHRDRLHHREELADRLWADSSPAQSKKSLRQTLWQLQTALAPLGGANEPPLLLTESEWMGLNPDADLWLDVAAFESAFAACQGAPGYQLDAQSGQRLQDAVQLYAGDLLENWYRDWCLCQRERLQTMYLTILSKLMSYCEANRAFEAGISYGQSILLYDRAHERTHRYLMRLLCRSGDRTGAIRQFQRCAVALQEELDVKPSRRTLALYEQVREDRLDDLEVTLPELEMPASVAAPDNASASHQLHRLQATLYDLQQQLSYAMQAIGVSAIHRQG